MANEHWLLGRGDDKELADVILPSCLIYSYYDNFQSMVRIDRMAPRHIADTGVVPIMADRVEDSDFSREHIVTLAERVLAMLEQHLNNDMFKNLAKNPAVIQHFTQNYGTFKTFFQNTKKIISDIKSGGHLINSVYLLLEKFKYFTGSHQVI